jgi:hypothetical protein
MSLKKDPNKITLQRISYGNIDRIEKLGKGKRKESFNDLVTKILNELEEKKKKKATQEDAWNNLIIAMKDYLKFEPDYEFVCFELEKEM